MSPTPQRVPDHAPDRAVVVFSGATELTVLRALRAGFRHCFVALRRGGAWVVIDPLAHRTDVEVVAAPRCVGQRVEADCIADLYRAQGLTVLVVAVRQPSRRLAPLRPYSCVEAVKRLIGRRAPWVLTPWQLYKFLEKENILDMRSVSC